MVEQSTSDESIVPTATDAAGHAITYLDHVLNKSIMAMYMDAAKKKSELDGVAIDDISAASAERIFNQKEKLFASILCLVEMGFKNLTKTHKQRSVSVKVQSNQNLAYLGLVSASSLSLRDQQIKNKQRIVDKYVGLMKEQCAPALARLTYLLEKSYKHHLSIVHNPLTPENLARYISVSTHTLKLEDNEKTPLLAVLLETLCSEYAELLNQTEQGVTGEGVTGEGVVGQQLPDLSEDDVAFRYEDEYAREASIIQRKCLWHEVIEDADLGVTSIFSIVSAYVVSAKSKSEPLGYLLEVEDGLPILDSDTLVEGMGEILSLPDFSYPDEEYLPPDDDVPSLAFQVQLVLDSHDSGLDPETIDTLNLLSMMFVYLDEQIDVHPTIKMLLDYMRVPFVQVAIKDHCFMFDARNPVQVLFDTLWSVCVKWSPSSNGLRDSVYNKVASIIERVNTEFVDDYQVIDECIEDIDLFNKAEKSRSKLIEGRLVSAEKARFLKEEANSKTLSHIDKTFNKDVLPRDFVEFVESSWKPVILMAHLKGLSPEGPEWKKIGEVETQLLSFFEGKGSWDSSVLIGRVEELLLLYGAQAQAGSSNVDSLRKLLSKPIASVGLSSLSAGGIPLPEMEVVEDEYFEQEEKASSSPMDSIEALVDKMLANTWVELSEKGVTSKCRVAALLEFSDTLVLVNRSGIKAGVYTKSDLASSVRKGDLSVSLMETSLFFDRALKGVDEVLGRRQ